MMRLAQKLDETSVSTTSDGAGPAFAVPEIDLQEYLRILWRQKRIILASIGVVIAMAIVIVLSLTPRYTATVFVEINPRQSQIVDFEAVLSGLPADNETIQTEIKIIQSRRLAQRTITRLDLGKFPEFNLALRPIGLIATLRQAIVTWLTSLAGDTEGDEPPREDGPKDALRTEFSSLVLILANILNPSETAVLSVEGAVMRENDRRIDIFLRNLTVAPEGRSRIIRISFERGCGAPWMS